MSAAAPAERAPGRFSSRMVAAATALPADSSLDECCSRHTVTMDAPDAAPTAELMSEHNSVLPPVEQILITADGIDGTPDALRQARRLVRQLETDCCRTSTMRSRSCTR